MTTAFQCAECGFTQSATFRILECIRCGSGRLVSEVVEPQITMAVHNAPPRNPRLNAATINMNVPMVGQCTQTP